MKSKWNPKTAKHLIKASKYKRSYIASLCKVSVGTLNHYLSDGKSRIVPGDRFIKKLAEALGVQHSKLLSAIPDVTT